MSEPLLGGGAESSWPPIKQLPGGTPPDQVLIAPFLQIFNFKTFHLAEADQGALSVTAGTWQQEWQNRKSLSTRASQNALIISKQ